MNVAVDTSTSNAVTPLIQDGPAQQILTFRVAGNEYGVDIMTIREIKGWSGTTRLPNTPEFVRGVMNLRGTVIPIFDLRKRFGQGDTDVTEKHVVIIMHVQDHTIGILVDAVSDILTPEEGGIRPAPQNSDNGLEDAFVKGLLSFKERVIVILDMITLFDSQILQQMQRSCAAMSSSKESVRQ